MRAGLWARADDGRHTKGRFWGRRLAFCDPNVSEADASAVVLEHEVSGGQFAEVVAVFELAPGGGVRDGSGERVGQGPTLRGGLSRSAQIGVDNGGGADAVLNHRVRRPSNSTAGLEGDRVTGSRRGRVLWK